MWVHVCGGGVVQFTYCPYFSHLAKASTFFTSRISEVAIVKHSTIVFKVLPQFAVTKLTFEATKHASQYNEFEKSDFHVRLCLKVLFISSKPLVRGSTM